MGQVIRNPKRSGYQAVASSNVSAAGVSPADATNYYFPFGIGAGWLTSAGVFKPGVSHEGTIRRVHVTALIGAVNGTNESVTYKIVVNGSVAATLDSAVTWDAGINAYVVKNYTGLAIAVAQGDVVELNILTPTWATNPTAMFVNASMFVEV